MHLYITISRLQFFHQLLSTTPRMTCKCMNRTANHTMPNGEGNSSDLQVQVATDSLGYRFQTFVASVWKLEYKIFHREEYFQ